MYFEKIRLLIQQFRKIVGKSLPILFNSSLRTGDADEKEVLKDAGLESCFLDTDLKGKNNDSTTQQDEFDAIINIVNQNVYEFMRNNQDSVGENSFKNNFNNEYT